MAYAQLLAHLAGDYLLQGPWLATNKSRHIGVAALHSAIYAACYAPITQNPLALALIWTEHTLQDHFYWRIYKHQHDNGRAKPFWLAVVIDNALHLLWNYAVISVLTY
jgi:ferric iron reductase protein FhuF